MGGGHLAVESSLVPNLRRIVRWVKPSAESFAAAAAVYCPDLMLAVEATNCAVDVLPTTKVEACRSHHAG